MASNISHHNEIHRQHIRLRIPITVEIEGTQYYADDWSIGGFGVQGRIPPHQPGDRFPVRLMFPFEDFEIVLTVDCELVYVTPDGERFGCRFLGLTAGQTELFRYMVEAYLSGELVSAGDVLMAVNRRAGGQLRPLWPEEEAGFGHRLRRWLGHGLLLFAAFALLFIIYVGVREKYLVVHTSDAVVWVPTLDLRSPLAGRVEAMPRKPIFQPGDAVARVVANDGSEALLESPCECVVLEWAAVPGSYVQTGEPLLTLAAADRPLVIRARLPLERARWLEVGQRAEVWVPGEREPILAQIERIDFKPERAMLGNEVLEPKSALKALVYLRPDRPLDFDLPGSLVEVRIP